MGTKIEGHGIPFDPIEPADLDTPPLKAVSEKNIIEDNAQPANLPQTKKTNSRIVLILLTIITLLFFSAAIALYVAKENEINQRLKVQAELEQLQSDKAVVDRELKSTLLVKEQLEIDLAQRKENYNVLLGQCQQQQSDNEALMEKFNEKMKLVNSLKGRLEKEEQDKKLLGSKFEAINLEYDDVKKQLSQIRMAKDALENRIL
ncbi:MAG: hypothetical protein L6366_07085 [Candidatus Omnitrophica bacterium]|nr:hypothetical protein [Candidatus Omnitrophota bacterium]